MIGGLEKVNNAMLEYTDLKSPIHKLTGATKLIALIIWAITAMVTYDTYLYFHPMKGLKFINQGQIYFTL